MLAASSVVKAAWKVATMNGAEAVRRQAALQVLLLTDGLRQRQTQPGQNWGERSSSSA